MKRHSLLPVQSAWSSELRLLQDQWSNALTYQCGSYIYLDQSTNACHLVNSKLVSPIR